MNAKKENESPYIRRKLLDVTIWSSVAIVLFYFSFEPIRAGIIALQSGAPFDVDKNWTAQIGTFAGLAVGILLGRNDERKKCDCDKEENRVLDYLMKDRRDS